MGSRTCRKGGQISYLTSDGVYSPFRCPHGQGLELRPNLDFSISRLLANRSTHSHCAFREGVQHHVTLFLMNLSKAGIVHSPRRVVEFLSQVVKQLDPAIIPTLMLIFSGEIR